MSHNGKASVSVSVPNAVPPQLRSHAFSSDNQPEKKGKKPRNRGPLSDCLDDYLNSARLDKDGRPPAHVLARYNTATRRIVETMIDIAGGNFTHFPGVTPKAGIAATVSMQKEIWQRTAGRPHMAIQLGPIEDIEEGITLVRRDKEVPLPLTAAELGGTDRGPRALPASS